VSYGIAAVLQAAVFARLSADTELRDLVGDRIFDGPPQVQGGEGAWEHVTLGEETVRPWNTATSDGALHDFDVTVHSSRNGFGAAKCIAGAICAALVDAPVVLDGARVVALRFLRAKAERGRAPERRKIALRFRAVLDEDS
jgi:hypothetical protein